MALCPAPGVAPDGVTPMLCHHPHAPHTESRRACCLSVLTHNVQDLPARSRASIEPHLGAGSVSSRLRAPARCVAPMGEPRRVADACCPLALAAPAHRPLSAARTRRASWPGAQGATRSGLFSNGRNSHAGNFLTSGCECVKETKISLYTSLVLSNCVMLYEVLPTL